MRANNEITDRSEVRQGDVSNTGDCKGQRGDSEDLLDQGVISPKDAQAHTKTLCT